MVVKREIAQTSGMAGQQRELLRFFIKLHQQEVKK